MAGPHKHHYVAAFYQRNFTNENGLLWVYDRWCQRFKELNPRSVCAEKDLYCLKRNGANDPVVELKVMAPVDEMGAAAIRRLRDDHAVEHSAIACFVGFQYTRLPAMAEVILELHERTLNAIMRTTAANEQRMQAVIDDYERDTGEKIDVPARLMVEAVQQNQLLFEVNKSVALKGMIEHAEDISRFVEALPWTILEASIDSGFIICDNPVTVVPPWGVDHIGVGIPGTVTYFPLTRRLCLRIGGNGAVLESRSIDRNTVRVINRNIAANSERFIMGPLKGQLETIISRANVSQRPARPRATIEVDGTPLDGGTISLRVNPRNHFYLNRNQA